MMLPALNSIERVSQKVWRVLGLNPGPFTLQGTNTYLIGEGRNRILIDTGFNQAGYKELLQSVLEKTESRIERVLLTHNHPDHVLGIKDILEINKETKNACTFHKIGYDEDDIQLEEKYGFKYSSEAPLEDNQIIQGDDFKIKVISTPGHCKDHVCFYLEEEKMLFTGDFILSGTSNVIRNLGQQIASFKRCMALDTYGILSAHGEAVLGENKTSEMLSQQFQHRMMRHEKISQAIRSTGVCSPEQVLNVVYPGLHESLVNGALHNISVHVKKLEEDKQVVVQQDGGLYQWVQQQSL